MIYHRSYADNLSCETQARKKFRLELDSGILNGTRYLTVSCYRTYQQAIGGVRT